MTPKLTIQVVTWNSAAVIEALLRSIAEQSFHDYELVVIDNASRDDTLAIVRRVAPNALRLENTANRGFSGAHNQGFRRSRSPFIAVVNPDIIVSKTALSTLVAKLEADPRIASISGKLLKSGVHSGIIDSTGILAKKTRKFVDRGGGRPDEGQFDTPQEVFGLSGAFVVLRRDALESIRIGEEYFDEDFFAYKEDIDLAWRLRSAGWINWYEPDAVLYHSRTAQYETQVSAALHGRKKPSYIKRLSYRNHLLLLLKNDRVRDWFFPLPQVFFYELGKAFYLLVREPKTFLGFLDALRLAPTMLRKRSIIIRRAHTTMSSISHWFV